MNYRHSGWIDFCAQQGGRKRGGSSSERSDKTGHEVNRTTVLFRLTPLGTKIAQSRRDEAEAGVRGVAGSGTYFNTPPIPRLALLQLLLSPVCQ
ncbi:MAG: hypothetical protein ACPGSB_02815 [Opitutales bacterium]